MIAVQRWLWVVFASVLVMVALGGVTRLTGAGLSMVEWHPLMGAVPPLNEADWQVVFMKYQHSPQYQLVNHWMQLEDFKRIFFWEYLHRLFGRLVGIVFIVPWLVFLWKRRLRGTLLRATFVALALGAAQGLMGWLMVKSGLVDRPSVSHFRLAAHLLLAFAVAQWVLWIQLNLSDASSPTSKVPTSPKPLRTWVAATLLLLVVQIAFGAFTAGTRAGAMFATFPDLNGRYAPGHFVQSFGALFVEPAAIHYAHRFLALLLVLLYAGLLGHARQQAPRVRRWTYYVAAIATIQVALGALTVIFHVPVAVAVAHQCVGFIMLSATFVLAYHCGVVPRIRFEATSSSGRSKSSST